ncbi:MAG: hypothetical protein NTW86_19685 [Candidatus Sumerlaeota bacterium]|nr:hypothetical protein [Candidatus Sumerlaeota bacterium]
MPAIRRTPFRTKAALVSILAAWIALSSLEADAMSVQWLGVQPAVPPPGATVTANFQITNSAGSSRSIDLGIFWKKPDGSELINHVQEVAVPAGGTVQLSDSATCPVGGRYTVVLYDMMDGVSNAFSTNQFDVQIDYLSGNDAIAAALTTTLTHQPPSPVGEQPSRGNPDRRSLVTMTMTFHNTHASKTVPACSCPIQVTDTQLQGNAALTASNYVNLPDIPPGQTFETQYQFKLNAPTRHKVEIRYGSYPNPILATYYITAVAYNAPSLDSPQFTPANPSPKTNVYIFGVRFKSPDNAPPDELKVGISAVPGQLFAMQRMDNGAPANGTWYSYSYSGSFPLGTYSYAFVAYRGGQEIASLGPCTGLWVEDTNPPLIGGGGQTQPDITIADSSTAQITGTASDAETNVARVEWRVGTGAWQTAQGKENWSFSYNSGIADQGHGEKTFYVRAVDEANNTTPQAKWLTQKVVWERRHPKVGEQFVTGTGANWAELNPVKDAKPPDLGPPRMGEYYYIAFKVVNSNPTQSYNLVLRWTEESFEHHVPSLEWDLGMTNPPPSSGDAIGFKINPGQTKWVWTTWSHNWNWLEEPEPVDFFADLLFMWIPVAGDIADGRGCCQWLQTMGAAVPTTTWKTVPHADTSAMLKQGGLTPISVAITVPQDKQDLVLVSFASAMCGMVGTAVASAASWTAVVGIVGAVYEVGCIAASHAAYYAAWDPNPDYQVSVKVKPIKVEALNDVKDPAEKKAGEAAVHFAEDMRAFRDAYTRHLGAVQARDAKAASMQAGDAARFAKAASADMQTLARWAQTHAKTLAKLDDQERARVIQDFRNGLPKAEKDLMEGPFGFDPKETRKWGEIHQNAMEVVLKHPDLAYTSAQRAAKRLTAIAADLEKRAKAKGKP